METEELARILRIIEIKEFIDDGISDHAEYDELPHDVKEMYRKFARVYMKYFTMERKI